MERRPERRLHLDRQFVRQHRRGSAHSTWRHVKFVERRQLGRSARRQRPTPFGWISRPTSASTASTPAASKRVRPARSSAPSSAASSSSPTSATAAATASSAVRSASSIAGRSTDGGGAFKCTFCYDRQNDGLQPACAKACPTESIQFGPLDELRARADGARRELRDARLADAHVYDPRDTSVGGTHAFFLLLGRAGGSRPAAASGSAHDLSSRRVAVGSAHRRRRPDRRLPRVRAAVISGEPKTAYYGLPILHAPVWTWQIGVVSVHRRRRRHERGRSPSRRSSAAHPAAFGARRARDRARRRRAVAGAAHLGPRPAVAIPEHAPRVQVAIGDVGRRLDARGLQRVRLLRRSCWSRSSMRTRACRRGRRSGVRGDRGRRG